MGHVRCEICRTRLPTPKRLLSHYLNGHSKFKLAREILKLSIKSAIPKLFAKKQKNKTDNGSETRMSKKTETVFANDSVQIFYRDNEIIIRDDKSSVDMEFSFDENSNEAKENCCAPEKVSNSKNDQKKTVQEVNNNNKPNKTSELRKLLKFKNNQNMAKLGLTTSSSSASSEDSSKKFSFKKRIRKKRDIRDKTRHYKINITRMKNCESLNESTGKFYLCHCRDDNRKKTDDNANIKKLASDTESASDTGRTSSFNDPKVFCSKCGNGYRDENLLLEHMKIHETHCRVCNEIFATEYLFKQHIQSHIFKVFVCHICSYEFPVKPMLHKHFESHVEDSILESVIDMEEDYNVTPCSLPSMTYQSSINSILCYLGENRDMYYYGNKLSKFYCDICLTEVFYGDYVSHMQSVHCIYGSN